MTRRAKAAWAAATVLWPAQREKRCTDDQGAVTTETAIITATLAVAAAGLAGYIASVVGNWQSMIPGG